MGSRPTDASYDAMLDIIASFRWLLDQREPSRTDMERARRKAQKWANGAQHLRVLLSVFQWRLVFVPFGIREVVDSYSYDDVVMIVTARQLHVFGVRVARWVKGVRYRREPLPKSTVEVPLKRSRLRRRRVKKSG
jgi:hypothetical protein